MITGRLILSANASLQEGGQGLNLQHMIEALRERFDLSVFCRSALDGLDAQTVTDSRLSGFIGKYPFIRRYRDWQTFFSDRHFDRFVAKRLSPAMIFQGVTGQCAESFLRARELGCKTVLDSVTTHMEDFAAHQDRECARFGVRSSMHPRLRARMLAEYQRADLIRVMSHHAEKTFLDRGFSAEQIVVVPPPIEPDDFPEASFSDAKFRVIFVGLIEPWKGFHYLVEAFNALRLKGSELVFWGGPGSRPVSRYLREQIARNPSIIIRPVSVRQFGYGNVYAKSTVFVQPSLADGFSYAVAEAMASGIPVIVTRNTGAADFVADGENGYIVPAGDSGAISERLKYLADNPSMVRKMGRAARQTARSLTLDAFRSRLIPRLLSLAS